ncbi:FAD-dependent oxidoreductase [Nocardiopsis alba]|uniref:FAD-dependent oxidoreductase n=1 Tax=Nocardiopsis alba TaxID=53437 RepID=UPI0035D71119
MGDHIGDRAVVLGAGMAGLLAARVLSETYERVVVVDRDALDGTPGARRGVPHGRHAHALLARGQQILEELFPGIEADLVASGVPSGDLAGDLRWYFRGRRLAPAHAGLTSLSATRPVLEEYVRGRVETLRNVEFMDRTAVRGPVSSRDRSRVVGVRVLPESGGESTLEADLVVDATGRGSRAPVWLEELGYQRPQEDRIKVDLAYTTRHYHLRSDPYEGALSINPVAWPGNPRGAFFPRLADGSSMLSLTGVLGDHPPTDPEGFTAFARSLPAPEIHEAIKDAEALDDPVTFRFPASVRKRYERLRRLPEGMVVLGDGVCSFNPVYGQGMTVAAMEAMALRSHLHREGGVRPTRYFREIARLIDSPWEISAGGDLGFPGVRGHRPVKVRVANAYMARLHTAAARDPEYTAAFFRVAGLVAPPQSLLRPATVLGVLRGSGAPPAASPRASTDDPGTPPSPSLRG